MLFRHNFSTLIDGLMCQFALVEVKRFEIKKIRDRILSKNADGPNGGKEVSNSKENLMILEKRREYRVRRILRRSGSTINLSRNFKKSC